MYQTRSLVASIITSSLVKWWSWVSWSWTFMSINNEVVSLVEWHDGHSPTLISDEDQVTKFTVVILRNVVTQSFDHEITSNHYFRRLPWMYQPSHRDRVIIKVHLRYSNGVGWGVCIKIGICPSMWRIGTLGPLVWHCINELASMWLGHEDVISPNE